MDGNEYQKLAGRTAGGLAMTSEQHGMIAAALGLTGEAGEFADMVKKVYYHGHPIDTDKLKKELGDILWYVALACTTLDTTINDVMELNVEKLKKRYPEGFSTKDSLERKDHN